MPLYRLTLEADFTTTASSRDVLSNRLRKMLRDAKFDEKNFECGVEAIKRQKGGAAHELPERQPRQPRP